MTTIMLAGGHRVSVATYVNAWRQCRAMVEAGQGETWLRRTPCSPTGGTVADALAELRAGALDRLNRHMPAWYGRGRKWSHDWQRGAREVAYRLPRRIITRERDCPRELRAKLADRLYRDDD